MDRLTGAGITIGDVDSLIDVFQLAFFRADAGYFDWIDVDHNGKIDFGERFVQLGTSKLAKIRVHVALGSPTDVDHVFVCGVDLSSMLTDITGGRLYGFGDAIHATGALSIAVGDVPLIKRK